MLRRVALVRTDVSEELSASFIKVTRIGELGTTLAVTSNRRTLRRNVIFSQLVRDGIQGAASAKQKLFKGLIQVNYHCGRRYRFK
jgi:hypothetical protein